MTNPLTNERDGTEVCISSNCHGDACAYPDCQRDPKDILVIDEPSKLNIGTIAHQRVGLLMSDPRTSARIRANMDDVLDAANRELEKSQQTTPLALGNVVVDRRWTCFVGNKYARVYEIATMMPEEERQHWVFKRRSGFHGELVFLGPQMPNESRQVYRQRLRKGVKKVGA